MFQSHIHTQGLCVSQWGSDPKAFVFSSEGLTPSLQGAQIIRCWKSVPVEGPQQGGCTSRKWKEREGAESAQEREQASESREREREQEREDRGRPEAKRSHLSQQTGASHSLRASHPEVKKKGPFLILNPAAYAIPPTQIMWTKQDKTKQNTQGTLLKGNSCSEAVNTCLFTNSFFFLIF